IAAFGLAGTEPSGRGGRLDQTQQQPVVAGKRRAEIGSGPPLRSGRTPSRRTIAPVGEIAVTATGFGFVRCVGTCQSCDGTVATVGPDHQGGADLDNAFFGPGVADARAALTVPDQIGDPAVLANVGARLARGPHE